MFRKLAKVHSEYFGHMGMAGMFPAIASLEPISLDVNRKTRTYDAATIQTAINLYLSWMKWILFIEIRFLTEDDFVEVNAPKFTNFEFL